VVVVVVVVVVVRWLWWCGGCGGFKTKNKKISPQKNNLGEKPRKTKGKMSWKKKFKVFFGGKFFFLLRSESVGLCGELFIV